MEFGKRFPMLVLEAVLLIDYRSSRLWHYWLSYLGLSTALSPYT